MEWKERKKKERKKEIGQVTNGMERKKERKKEERKKEIGQVTDGMERKKERERVKILG